MLLALVFGAAALVSGCAYYDQPAYPNYAAAYPYPAYPSYGYPSYGYYDPYPRYYSYGPTVGLGFSFGGGHHRHFRHGRRR